MKKIFALAAALVIAQAQAGVEEIPAGIIKCTSTVNELPFYDVTLTSVSESEYQVNVVKTVSNAGNIKEWYQLTGNDSLVSTDEGVFVKVDLGNDNSVVMSTESVDGKVWTGTLNLGDAKDVALACSHTF